MQYIILEKAGSAEKGHKAYARTVKGKLQQVKQKGAVKPDKKKEKDEKKVKPKVNIGHVILVAGKQKAKITAVGKDGVTAKDSKGNKYLILHNSVKQAEKKDGNGKKPGEGKDERE
jgi:preprotein translocase subunit YajC